MLNNKNLFDAVLETIPENSRQFIGLISDRQPLIDITPGNAWSNIEEPKIYACDLHGITVEPGLTTDLEICGRDGKAFKISRAGLNNLGKQIGFRSSFIEKLSRPTQSIVINEIIKSSRNQEFSFLVDGRNEIYNLTQGWRDYCLHKEICEVGYQSVHELISTIVDGPINCSVTNYNGMLDFKIITPLQEEITANKGDALSAGLNIKHNHSKNITVGLYVDRLVCENGMVVGKNEFSWASKSNSTVKDQLLFVVEAARDSLKMFDKTINSSRQMAEAFVHGDIHNTIMQRLKQMRIPKNHIDGIMESFAYDPGNSEWHILNAITHYATHSLTDDPDFAYRLMNCAGNWAHDFDIVTARMPRPIANSVGAEIIED